MVSTSLLNFLAKHGRGILFDIQELRNKGLSHQCIAEKLDIDPGNWSKYYREFFVDKCELKPHILETLQILNTIEQEKIGDARRIKARIFELASKSERDSPEAG